MQRIVLLVLALGLAGPLWAQGFPALFGVHGVAANDVLNIRAEPSAAAPVVGILAPRQTGVEVIAVTADGRWGRVRTGESGGWAAMRFLARRRSDAWNDGQQAITCAGTEPFWSLALSLPGNGARFESPADGAMSLKTDAPVLPATHAPPTLAVPFTGARGGMAVIRAAACSDGMSDRPHGLEVQLYWRGATEGLTGCCALMP